MSPTCDTCFGLIADESGIIEYEGDFQPSLCHCLTPLDVANARIAYLEGQLDICASAAIFAQRTQFFLQGEVQRLEEIISSMIPGSRISN